MTCALCGETRDVGPTGHAHCRGCAFRRREAVQRILRLRPTLDRLVAAVVCARKLATIATVGAQPTDWKDLGPQWHDYRILLTLLDDIERDLEAEVDDWSLLLLRVHAAWGADHVIHKRVS